MEGKKKDLQMTVHPRCLKQDMTRNDGCQSGTSLMSFLMWVRESALQILDYSEGSSQTLRPPTQATEEDGQGRGEVRSIVWLPASDVADSDRYGEVVGGALEKGIERWRS